MLARGIIPKFNPRITEAIRRWDLDCPTTERSVRARHLLVFSVVSELLNEHGIPNPELMDVRQVSNYSKLLQVRTGPSGVLNKLRAMRKLLHYMGIPDKKNPYYLELLRTPLKKPHSAGQAQATASQGQKAIKCKESPHVLREVLSGIHLLNEGQGVSPSVLHRELFLEDWSISHTAKACQSLEKLGFLTSYLDDKRWPWKKYYSPTGKKFDQTEGLGKGNRPPKKNNLFSKERYGQVPREIAQDNKPQEKLEKRFIEGMLAPQPSMPCYGRDFLRYAYCRQECKDRDFCEKALFKSLDDRRYQQGQDIVCLLRKVIEQLDNTITKPQASRLIQENIEIKETLKRLLR